LKFKIQDNFFAMSIKGVCFAKTIIRRVRMLL